MYTYKLVTQHFVTVNELNMVWILATLGLNKDVKDANVELNVLRTGKCRAVVFNQESTNFYHNN